MRIKQLLDEKKKIIDKALENNLSVYFGNIESKLYTAMHYSLFPGGKRLRPILAIVINEVLGGKIDKVINSACAIEFIHSALLILDDLPSMDNSDFRRCKPACHKMFGESTAILTSIGFISRSFEMLSNEFKTNNIPSSVIVTIVQEVAQRIGVFGVIGGQFADLNPDQNHMDLKNDKDKLDYIALHKTASLFILSATVGAYLANAKGHEIHALIEYARNFGYAFQVSDDLIDTEDTNSLTFPKVYGFDQSLHLLKQKIEQSISNINFLGKRSKPLRDIARLILNRVHNESKNDKWIN
jgi:geranylgeranyl diphosphate synthase type II